MHEGVVVREFDEGSWPGALDLADLGDDLVDRLDLVERRQSDGGGAELAAPRAAALSLDGDPVVAVDVQQVETGHGRIGQAELAPIGRVRGLHTAGREVVQ